jgi:hypothetical protein
VSTHNGTLQPLKLEVSYTVTQPGDKIAVDWSESMSHVSAPRGDAVQRVPFQVKRNGARAGQPSGESIFLLNDNGRGE